MRLAKFLAPTLAVGLFAASAAAEGLIQLHEFYVAGSTPDSRTLCVVAPPEAHGRPCEISANFPAGSVSVGNVVLMPGSNYVIVPEHGGEVSYTASGPGIQPKYVLPGVN